MGAVQIDKAPLSIKYTMAMAASMQLLQEYKTIITELHIQHHQPEGDVTVDYGTSVAAMASEMTKYVIGRIFHPGVCVRDTS